MRTFSLDYTRSAQEIHLGPFEARYRFFLHFFLHASASKRHFEATVVHLGLFLPLKQLCPIGSSQYKNK